MKKTFILSLLAFSFAITTNCLAQPGDRAPRKQLTPKEIAEQKADHLQKELSLTDKQRKKVYKLYLSEANALQSASSSDFRPSGPPPGGGPGGDWGEAGMAPPSGMGNAPGGPGRMPQESEEDIAKREAKMKKILSDEQYDQWVKLEKQRKHKEFQDKLLRDSEKPLRD